MTVDDQIRDEKLQYDINREAAKISVLSSGKIDKYGYLTGEEILPSNQRQILEQANLFFFRKSFWKTNKNNWRSRRKTNKAIKNQGQVKTKNILMMMKIVHWFQSKRKYLTNLQMKELKK